ncbi:hypothetical protein L484_002257 [Morus notabilis]|uniref:Uncharacterized protein n=1 Tax=Morus notabilis TaxID=981085 RepID=W9SUY2_9ROSA|nr:hypothetical protein L484_002257 [Morus notabilis]
MLYGAYLWSALLFTKSPEQRDFMAGLLDRLKYSLSISRFTSNHLRATLKLSAARNLLPIRLMWPSIAALGRIHLCSS